MVKNDTTCVQPYLPRFMFWLPNSLTAAVLNRFVTCRLQVVAVMVFSVTYTIWEEPTLDAWRSPCVMSLVANEMKNKTKKKYKKIIGSGKPKGL